ncbi:MAG: flagellar filament protein, partial [Gemmobacter sp.]
MGISINTNVGALSASAATGAINKSMEISMERLSTGKRINTAADDAAGVAIASRLTSEIRGTNQAIRNASDAQALIDTAEGAHDEVVNLLQRMRELSVQAANDTNSAADRTNIQAEMTALSSEIDRIASTTTWAGKNLLDHLGGSQGGAGARAFSFQIGARTNAGVDDISASINGISSTRLSVQSASSAYATADGTPIDDTNYTVAPGATPGTNDSAIA